MGENAFLVKSLFPEGGETAGCGAVLQPVETRTVGPEDCHCFLLK